MSGMPEVVSELKGRLKAFVPPSRFMHGREQELRPDPKIRVFSPDGPHQDEHRNSYVCLSFCLFKKIGVMSVPSTVDLEFWDFELSPLIFVGTEILRSLTVVLLH